MRHSSAARRYAHAAFDVARQNHDVDLWLRDLKSAAEALADVTVAHYFKDPNVPTEAKLTTLERVFPDVSTQVANLLRMLALRERLHLLPAIHEEFESLDREARGVVEAEATVARTFEDSEREQIARQLSNATGKTVEVQMKVDPAILGGIIVRIGDRLIDASVSGRLERLRQVMAV